MGSLGASLTVHPFGHQDPVHRPLRIPVAAGIQFSGPHWATDRSVYLALVNTARPC